MEPLENLHILPPRRRRPPRHRQLTDHPVDVLTGDIPRRTPQRRQRPLQQPNIVVDRHQAESSGMPRRHERINAFTLKQNGIRGNMLDRCGTTGNQPQTLH